MLCQSVKQKIEEPQKDMQCAEIASTCVVRDTTPGAKQKKLTVLVRPSFTVNQLYSTIAVQFPYEEFELTLKNDTGNVSLKDKKDKLLQDVGITFNVEIKYVILLEQTPQARNNSSTVICNDKKNDEVLVFSSPSKESSDDELALGASASPAGSDSGEPSSNIPLPPALPMLQGVDSITSNYKSIKFYSSPGRAIGYVGLVNQAMTCYLNSLLQALYMTPEFRNALYNWEFDGVGESKSIPYQLQKLFLNLQTSSKVAVETTDLTKSFGWDSTEAWQQHDIQELCRVMFDALEQKFKNTAQSDLINRLYEGKMIDYVKCLECGTEKSREDKFLDIPLPVRPFGSAVAYGSVEEALKAFVQPETLDGNNQYFCEKCNKKCDAHKGLKFSKFSYILTLHLKRFDFDYQICHRIKLNDRVTFPQTLNLNGYIGDGALISNSLSNGEIISSENESIESAIKLSDDCSTTDSGSALDEDGISPNYNTNGLNNENDLQEYDEGIDMTPGIDSKQNLANQSGPFIYELFAIMIHSGNASGGHYYAYIKDFDTSEWFCFNDQTVQTITQEDIQKSFGGGSKTYYSGAYSASINAYMLMYRQMDNTKNCKSMKYEDFPDHIKKLLTKLKEKEENDKKLKEIEAEMQKLKIFCSHPKKKQMTDCRLFKTSDATLEETLKDAYSRLHLENIVPIERCRLVAYDSKTENCEVSFEQREQDEIGDIMRNLSTNELLLEIREENSEFEIYQAGGIITRVYLVDTETPDIDGPIQIRCNGNGGIVEMKKLFGKKLGLKAAHINIAMVSVNGKATLLQNDDTTIVRDQIMPLNKLYVAVNVQDVEKFKQLVEKMDQIITLYMVLPKTDKATLKKLNIPSYERLSLGVDEVDTDEVDAKPLNSKQTKVISFTASSVVTNNLMEAESNSEDSSLSDGDRTLVESPPGDLSRNNSPIVLESFINDDEAPLENGFATKKPPSLFFKATEYFEPTPRTDNEPQAMLKVLVDRNMQIGKLKENLEPILKVSRTYFKIFKTSAHGTEMECNRMSESLCSYKDGERLIIELGRKGEYKLKVYFLKLSDITDDTEDKTPFLCDWVFRNGAKVGDTKRDLLAYVSQLDSKYNIPFDKCRLRKKGNNNPQNVFMDDQLFDRDIDISSHQEVILQDVSDGTSQPVTDPDDIVVFVRRWNLAEMTLSPFHEITMTNDNEFRQVLSEISKIPLEHLEYTKITGIFSRSSMSVGSLLTIQSWNAQKLTIADFPMNGYIYCYKDNREKIKEMTPEERREIQGRDSSRLDRLGGTPSIHSPRKERALKIYLDSSPRPDPI